MKNLWLTLVLVMGAMGLSAQNKSVRCDAGLIEQGAAGDPVMAACLSEGASQGLSQFPSWLADERRICSYLQHAPQGRDIRTCEARVVALARSVLECPSSPVRQREAVALDLVQITSYFGGFEKVPAPDWLQKQFDSLVDVANQNFKFRFGKPNWKLIVYENKAVNATASADGTILISRAFWSDPETAYPRDEIEAVLAHEIGHVLRDHSLKLGCLAIEWIGPENTIQTATEAFREDFHDGFPRKEAWKKMSQAFEYDADAMSARLLKRAGRDPQAMVRVLNRMRPKDGGGFASGSHPEMDERISSLRRSMQAQ